MSESTIQWYPGHMVRAMRRLGDDVRLVDVVVEAVAARVPHAGANVALARLTGGKPRLLVLTRADLADPALTDRWLAHYRAAGRAALAVDAKERPDMLRLRAAFADFLGERRRAGHRNSRYA